MGLGLSSDRVTTLNSPWTPPSPAGTTRCSALHCTGSASQFQIWGDDNDSGPSSESTVSQCHLVGLKWGKSTAAILVKNTLFECFFFSTLNQSINFCFLKKKNEPTRPPEHQGATVTRKKTGCGKKLREDPHCRGSKAIWLVGRKMWREGERKGAGGGC